jgi:methionyl-tRNA formyltransferase
MRLVFMGSGEFALPSLEALLASRHAVAALVTQPDKPAGRGHALRRTPTKILALARGIEVHQPARVRTEESVALVRELGPECIVVVAYGQIIPRSILEIPPRGILNVHGSLLPRYRGAAPVQWAIARGETETGVTTMLMDEGLDTGPILLQRSVPILEEDTGGSLEEKLAAIGADLLLETLARLEQGALVPAPQDESRSTLAPRITREDGRVDWSWTARRIHDRARAFDPWPNAWAQVDGAPLKLWKTLVVEDAIGESGEPGTILRIDAGGAHVACGEGTRLALLEVQSPGKARVSGADFARGKRLVPGSRLDP